MREIRFRAWDKVKGEMILWNRLLNWYNLRNVFMRPEMCGLILMQFTGLKDKNGVEIFEGDWIRVETQEEDNGEFPIGYVVRANDEPNMFIALPEQLKETGERQYHLESLYEHYSGEFEVIGNIYQNKDLLGAVNEL